MELESEHEEQWWEQFLQVAPCSNHSAHSFIALHVDASIDWISIAIKEFKFYLSNMQHVAGDSLVAVVQHC